MGLVKATRACYPYKLMGTKGFQTETEARQEEYRIKKMKSRNYIENLLARKW
jgi:predicted GIY-YIG superfamily endonuclease